MRSAKGNFLVQRIVDAAVELTVSWGATRQEGIDFVNKNMKLIGWNDDFAEATEVSVRQEALNLFQAEQAGA
jgi:hypothetical protein